MAENQVHESATEEKELTQAEEPEGEGLVAVVDRLVLDPLAVLVGALNAAPEDEEINCRVLGRLLAMIIRGARVELQIQENGGYDAQGLRDILGMRISVKV